MIEGSAVGELAREKLFLHFFFSDISNVPIKTFIFDVALLISRFSVLFSPWVLYLKLGKKKKTWKISPCELVDRAPQK